MNTLSRLIPSFVIASLLTLLGSCSLHPESRPNRCVSDASLINPETNAAPGIGGTGQVAGRPGIGGTGQIAETGIGGTGIVGVVTGFASICVNGEEIHYAPATPVSRDGEQGSTRDLQVGQVVAVQATAQRTESGSQWLARQIVVQHALIGPLTRLDVASSRFEVMGEQVLALSAEDLADLKPGLWVRVSGHRQADGSIRAGRVQSLPSPARLAQVQGPITEIQGHAVRVGNTPVLFSTLPGTMHVGQEVLVRGQWNGQQLQARESTQHPTAAALQGSNRVLLQAYVHALRGNKLDLGYESVLLPEKTMSLEPGQQVLIRGRINADQHIVAEQIVFGSGQGNRGRFSHAGRGSAASSGHGGRDGGAGNAGNAGSGPGGGAGGGGAGGGSGGGGGNR